MQGGIQEDIPVIQIYTLQIEEIGAGEVNSGANDCVLISDPTKNFYEDLVTLFPDLKSGDKKVEQLYINSAIVVDSCDNTIGFRRYTQKPDTGSKRASWKFLNLLEAGIGTKKKAGMIPEKRFAGFDGIIVGRGVIKSKNHS